METDTVSFVDHMHDKDVLPLRKHVLGIFDVYEDKVVPNL